ncbi:MAG: glycosyltransferase family 2 protein, partial [Rhodopila sp.]
MSVPKAAAPCRSQRNRTARLISVVVPLYNEIGNVAALISRLHDVLASLPHRCEIVLVDDGSRDGTWDAIVARVAASPEPVEGDAAIIGCRLSRNFGHQAALLAGLEAANGDAIITMDGDLQHPPEVIPDLVRRWLSGFDIVLTQRLDMAGTGTFKRLTSRWFYRLFSVLAEVELHEGSSDFRLIDRQVLREILRLRDTSLFLRGTVEWIGFSKTTVPYNMAERFS